MFKKKKIKEDKKIEENLVKNIPDEVDKIEVIQKRDDRDKICLFKLNMENAEYEEILLEENIFFFDLLEPSSIFLFLEPKYYKAYLWQGKDTSIRERFVSANRAGSVTSLFSRTMKIITIEEEEESMDFKVMIGVEEPSIIEESNKGPIYNDRGSKKDNEIIEEMTKTDIIKILNKLTIPENFQRDFILIKGKLYKIIEEEKEESDIVKKLFPLKELTPNGTFELFTLHPRILLKDNDIVLTEFFSVKEESNSSKLHEYFQITD